MSFLPGELEGSERCGAATHSSLPFGPSFFVRKNQLERREFLPGELGVRTVRACQPTTYLKHPIFFRQGQQQFPPW